MDLFDKYDLNRISNLVFLKKYSTIPILSEEDEHSFFVMFNGTDDKLKKKARDVIFYCNMRLVSRIAYIAVRKRSIGFDDLISYGSIGLIEAINSFDISKGCRFSTFAFYRVYAAVMNACFEKSNNIRIPSSLYKKIGVYNEAVTTYNSGIEGESLYDFLVNHTCLTMHDIQLIECLLCDTISIDYLLDSDEFGFQIVDESIDIEGDIDLSFLRNNISEIIKIVNLSDRDRQIIYYRFGLCGYPVCTYTNIASKFKLTHQRVKQIVDSFCRKVRENPKCMDMISGYSYCKKL